MSYLCYTLDEAAQQLGMSDTVLFRLSQFLKIPANAYDDVGYIAFNGDLSFNDEDISFFKQVKERLLTGETLEDIKSRLRHTQEIKAKSAQTALISKAMTPKGSTTSKKGDSLNTMETDAHLKREADKSFNRYKAQHRPKLNQVFQNIAQNIAGVPKEPAKKPAAPVSPPPVQAVAPIPMTAPAYPAEMPYPAAAAHPAQPAYSQPMPPVPSLQQQWHRPEAQAATRQPIEQAQWQPSQPTPAPLQQANIAPVRTEAPPQPQQSVWDEDPWVSALQSATEQPRSLNIRLRAAAQTLRQQAIQKLQQRQQGES